MNPHAILDNSTLYPSAYWGLTNKGYINVAKVESRASLFVSPQGVAAA